MNILSGDLPRSKTYSWRRWVWVGNDDPTRPGHGYDGKLTVIQQKGQRSGCRCEADCYLVEEQPPVGWPGRTFLLLNESDPTQSDVYQTRLGVRPWEWACTCKAGSCGLLCKHVEALRALLAEGALPDPRENPGADVGPTEVIEVPDVVGRLPPALRDTLDTAASWSDGLNR